MRHENYPHLVLVDIEILSEGCRIRSCNIKESVDKSGYVNYHFEGYTDEIDLFVENVEDMDQITAEAFPFTTLTTLKTRWRKGEKEDWIRLSGLAWISHDYSEELPI